MLFKDDCLSALKEMSANSVDALVTDPPAGISFMGKAWDSDKGGRKEWVAWMSGVMSECLRVMKPGAHGLIWALPRTSHWTATALEDAGFEVRDVVTHLFGSGFPKSLNIEKAGAGKEWQGWGTALKPAAEFWWLVRKPCSEKTVAANVLKWGTGALNIDASRIASEPWTRSTPYKDNIKGGALHAGKEKSTYECGPQVGSTQGRFPANLVLDEEAAAALDGQSAGTRASKPSASGKSTSNKSASLTGMGGIDTNPSYSDSGGASRFFYCAKISSSERNEAGPNGHPTVKAAKLMRYLCKLVTPPGGTVLDPFMGSGSTGLAALTEGFKFIGIEREAEYHEIAEKRIYHAFPEFRKQVQRA